MNAFRRLSLGSRMLPLLFMLLSGAGLTPALAGTFFYNQATIIASTQQPITPDGPTPFRAAAYTVTPPLPAGLNLSGRNGFIWGTPTTATTPSSPTQFTVTQALRGGRHTATLTIKVFDLHLGYPDPSPVYRVGSAITPQTPTYTSGVLSFSVAPPLPAGLAIDAFGTLSGTPTAPAAPRAYVVTGTWPGGGLATATLFITVRNAPPDDLTYSYGGGAPNANGGNRLTADTIKKEIPDYGERIFYLSGTHAMTNASEKILREMGIPHSHIKTDFFPGFA